MKFNNRYALFIAATVAVLAIGAFFAWREHQHEQLEAKRNVIYTACVAAMLQNTCAVMQSGASAAVVSPTLYATLRAQGESMCQTVYKECADWKRESCNALRLLYSPSLPR